MLFFLASASSKSLLIILSLFASSDVDATMPQTHMSQTLCLGLIHPKRCLNTNAEESIATSLNKTYCRLLKLLTMANHPNKDLISNGTQKKYIIKSEE